MPVLKGNELIEDSWTRITDQEFPAGGEPALVGLEHLERDWCIFRESEAPLGVVLPAGTKLEEVAPYLARLELIAIDFPKFRDGRGFTIARNLRERHNFQGEIRAVGHLIADQYALLLRTGFSSVEISETAKPAVWLAAAERYKVAYQPGLTAEHGSNWLRREI